MLRRVGALLAIAAASALAMPAAAFVSLPGGPHDDITDAAARESGFPEAAIGALVESVRAVDLRDNVLEPSVDKVDRIDASGSYRQDHHCDRVPPANHSDSFNATALYVADRLLAAREAMQAGDPNATVRALGEMLHAIQDCLSHSNAVDLPDPQVVVAAVTRDEPAPPGLLLTGFQPGADDPESPEGDPYPHAAFAKDDAGKNDESGLVLPDGRTKYEAARALAIEASILALQDFLRGLDTAQLKALAGVEDGGQPLPKVAVPSLPLPLLLGVLAVASACLRRRR